MQPKAILAVEPPRPGQPVLIDFENPRHRGRQSMDEYALPPTLRDHSLHLEQDWPAVNEFLPIIERELAPFRARPPGVNSSPLLTTNGKIFTPRCPNSSSSLRNYNPQGEFRNEFLNKNTFASSRRAVRQAFWGLKPPSHSPPSPLQRSFIIWHLVSSTTLSLEASPRNPGLLLSKSRNVAHISPSKLQNRPGRLCLLRGKIFTFSAISANYERECLCV